jgi:acyl-CoA synthetase (AMP-forming)/AMP-acid ligase II
MDPGTLRRLNALFPGVRIIQKYGTTETGSPRTTSRGNDSLWLSIRSDDIEAKVIDQMLWIRGTGSTLGYLNAPSPIAEDGWYCTGDLVEVDGEWIRFRGRATDIINVGGEKVSPAEVEQTILELDCVGNAVVFGEPHVLLGRVVAARVSLTPRAPRPTTPQDSKELVQRIRLHCRRRLASHKVPIRIEVTTDELISDRHKAQRKPRSGSSIHDSRQLAEG